MATVGDRIREIREAKRLTQDQLAERTGISKGFLSDVENSKRNVSSEYLLRIANALGASIDYLLRGTVSVVAREAITIPPELSEAAEKLDLSYAQTVEVLEAYRSVVARRSSRSIKQFGMDDWVNLYRALSKAFD
ncbi:MAG: helix-turn-helix domain-containing protein [Acidobacteriota bacterium]|nr:helix-turn-helix domain-containing protein [Acidobacteriota bacterium]